MKFSKLKKYGSVILLSVTIGFSLAFIFFRITDIKRTLGLYNIPYDKINKTSQEHKDLIRPAIFNIEDFGGSLDSEDNSSALQAAIDAAIITSTELRSDDKWDIYVGKVYIPAGHWRFERGISSDIGVEIIGDGVGKTYLDFTGSGIFMDFGSENEKFDLKIKDLFINQFDSNATAIHLNQVNRNSGISNIIIEGGGIGLSLLNCYTPSFDSFFIYNASKYGILGRNATNTDFSNFKVENCKVGAKFTNSDINSSTGLKFFGGVIQGCYDEGLILEDLTNFTSFSTFLEGNGRNQNKPQIKITSDLNEKFDNDIIAFYSPFITGGHSAHKDQNAVEVDNTYTFIFNESFIRANDRILTGIKVGKNVINAEILNSKYSGVKQNFIIEDPTTNLVLDPKLRDGRGYGRQFLGLGSESGKTNNRHYMESYQGIFGNLKEGKIGIGTFNGKPSLQGFGNGSSYSLTTNPKIGDHISAPNGITEISGIKFGTTITSSNVKTDKKSRNIIVNTNEGKRSVTISLTEEEIRRELIIKNSGSNSNDLDVSSNSTNIEDKKVIRLRDGEAITLIFDGDQWLILSKFLPTNN
ncbi:glycosyl hydrolase family 28-related protein [Maribacter sp. 4G9]|uniref:glycosyl hydrolase family 28-related protein n=1 Tax=Maribacter sp. 4G9 TaxID=1889777 RepID=UPI000C15A5EC|nr:glycosyl hydrolase family 28-related protein [Maribacter sp. 4G9]PIB23376.1 hypothetical protein BFP75_10235 [Maribacter sp. 4G9]